MRIRVISTALGLTLAAPPAHARAAHAQAPAYPPDRDQVDRTQAPAYPPDRDLQQVDSTQLPPELPAELVLPPVAAMLQAQRLGQSGRHLEAALLFESLWAETNDPRLGYHAALARARAGQHLLAWHHLTRVREQFKGEAVRAHLDAKLAVEQTQIIAVRLRVVEAVGPAEQEVPPAALAAATLTLEANREPGGARQNFKIPMSGDALSLDTGPWMVRLEVPGYLPVTAQQFALPGTAPIWTVLLTRREVAIQLRFSPPRMASRATLRLTGTDRSPSPVIERVMVGPTTNVLLTTGSWRLEVRGRRHQADLGLTVTPAMGPVDIVLNKRPPAESLRFDRNKKFAIGVLASFGAAYAVGVGLILGGVQRETRTEDDNDALLKAEGVDPKADTAPDPAALARIEAAYPTRSYHHDLKIASNLNMSGVHVALGGLGAAVAVLPVMLGARRRVAYIELGVGAVFLAGGSAWLATFLQRRERLLAPDATRITESEFDKLTGAQLGASMLTSIGIGLVAFSALALIVDESKRRRGQSKRFTLDTGPGPGLAGASLRARF